MRQLQFDREIPESVLAHKPLRMLIQCVDRRHVRLGFKGAAEEPWRLSQPYDASQVLGGKNLGRFDMHCWSSATGEMYGAPPGGPMYQKFLIDYIRYRDELTIE